MTMFEQARRCLFGLTKTFFSRFSKSAFSRHDNVRASSTLFTWLNENVHFIKTHTQLNCFATYYSLLLGDVQLIKNGCYLRQGLFSVNNR